MKTLAFSLLMLLSVTLSAFSQVKEVPFTQEDRERIIRNEEQIKLLRNEMNAHFDKMDKRLSGLGNEYESLQRNMITNLDRILLKIVIANVLVIITFCYLVWDRFRLKRKLKIKTHRMEAYFRKLKSQSN